MSYICIISSYYAVLPPGKKYRGRTTIIVADNPFKDPHSKTKGTGETLEGFTRGEVYKNVRPITTTHPPSEDLMNFNTPEKRLFAR